MPKIHRKLAILNALLQKAADVQNSIRKKNILYNDTPTMLNLCLSSSEDFPLSPLFIIEHYSFRNGRSAIMQTTLKQNVRNSSASATKWKILAAAEEVMSQKGFSSSLISEIARKANVANSVIYLYFKSKQDLLFSVPGEKLKKQNAQLKEHLA